MSSIGSFFRNMPTWAKILIPLVAIVATVFFISKYTVEFVIMVVAGLFIWGMIQYKPGQNSRPRPRRASSGNTIININSGRSPTTSNGYRRTANSNRNSGKIAAYSKRLNFGSFSQEEQIRALHGLARLNSADADDEIEKVAADWQRNPNVREEAKRLLDRR